MTFIDDIYVGGKLEVRLVSYDKKWTYLADALGSTRKVLSNGQASTATFTAVTYKPFGAVVTVTGGDKLTYAGEMLDPPTGLIYLSARYYDPTLGRFYALDPELGRVSQPQTLNRYVYCANSPLIHTDPTGRFLNFLIQAAIGAAAGAVIGGLIAAATGQDMNHIAEAMLIGAVSGAVFALTFGAASALEVGFAGANVAAGVASGVASTVVSAGVEGKSIEPKELVFNAAIGGITAYGGGSLGKFMKLSSGLGRTTENSITQKLAAHESTYINVKGPWEGSDSALIKMKNPLWQTKIGETTAGDGFLEVPSTFNIAKRFATTGLTSTMKYVAGQGYKSISSD